MCSVEAYMENGREKGGKIAGMSEEYVGKKDKGICIYNNPRYKYLGVYIP